MALARDFSLGAVGCTRMRGSTDESTRIPALKASCGSVETTLWIHFRSATLLGSDQLLCHISLIAINIWSRSRSARTIS
ncbi:MAG: hypothetical protein FVQ83_16540 [Chloroflexi bacterium]|nr:hypothetical protein [Chloroflexota bacterium]